MILDGICLQNAMNCSMSSFLNQQITPHDSMKNKICGSFYCNRTIQNAGNIQIAVLSAQNDIIRHNIRDFVIVIYFHFFHPLSSLNYSTGREPPTRRYIFTMNDIILSTQNGEPVASSRDVAKRFGKEHKNVMQAVANLVAENSAAKSMFHPATFENRGKKYPMYLMNRDGFSLLAMGFTGKEAVQWKLKYIKAFNQMEKQLAQRPQLSRAELMAQALIAAHDELEHKDAQIAELTPKGIFADAVSASKKSILVGELAKLLCQNGVQIGQNRLFSWMREHGYLIRDPKRSDYNMPTQRAVEMCLFEIKETTVVHSDGHTSINKTPKVTGKGQIYFVNQFLNGRAKRLEA